MSNYKFLTKFDEGVDEVKIVESQENNYIKSKYTAIIVEPREHPALEYVLLNILNNLNEDWSVVLLHGNKNIYYVYQIIAKHSHIARRIDIFNLGIDNLNRMEYSDMFFDERFYNFIPTEMFLVFQTDSMIIPENKDKIYDFINYDYVGGPWPETNGEVPLQVGNGGFSLRRKSKMLELLSHKDAEYLKHKNISRGNNYYIEDLFFSGIYHEGVHVNKPLYEKAKEFSAEAEYGIDPFGVHSVWNYKNVYENLIYKYPIIRELEELNLSSHSTENSSSPIFCSDEFLNLPFMDTENSLSLEHSLDERMKNIKYTAIIAEPREHPALEFVLLNILNNLNEEWCVVLLHGNKNINYVYQIISKYPQFALRIYIFNLGIDNLNKMEYSDMFFDERFYNFIPTEIFLVFQTDSMIIPENKDKLYDFINYDYVGGPWPENNYRVPLQVGNGGFSLRKKSKMLELLTHRDAEYLKHKNIEKGNNFYLEDVFFCGLFHEEVHVNKPSYEKAKEFSVESIYDDNPFGIHAVWKVDNVYQKLIRKYPIIKELRDLNF
jgi:hypothetical protein